jgi:MFS family permease
MNGKPEPEAGLKAGMDDQSQGKPIPSGAAAAAAATVKEAIVPLETSSFSAVNRTAVSKGFIWALVLATFGVYVAFIAPIALSLAVQVQALAPANEEYLGYIIGIGAGAAVLTAPLIGILSDRTKSRLGRRRPYLLGGAVLGTIALVIMASAPSILVLGLGWILAQVGWGAVLTILLVVQADKLPEEQRGRVAGLTGFTQMVAPIVGAGLASIFVWNAYLMFLIPGSFGVIFVLIYCITIRGDDSRRMTFAERGERGAMLRKYVYNPRTYTDFSWNWLARFFFNIGVGFNTTFTAFFFASRVGATVAEIGPLIALLGLLGVAAAAAGALGGGYLSDKFKRRRLFVMVSGILFTVGALVMAFSTELPLIIAGSVITSLALGAFASVDHALVLDVLPERDTDAGRFMGINGFSTSIPQAIAPLIAPAILLIGMQGSDRNYTLLFIAASIFTLIGGAIVMLKVKGAN